MHVPAGITPPGELRSVFTGCCRDISFDESEYGARFDADGFSNNVEKVEYYNQDCAFSTDCFHIVASV
jgi:hypothetical protein